MIALVAILDRGQLSSSSAFNRARRSDRGQRLHAVPRHQGDPVEARSAGARSGFYYSQGSSAVPVGLKTFAKRVEDLLAEYRARVPAAKSSSRNFNPEPDSDAEDSATLDGVEGPADQHAGEVLSRARRCPSSIRRRRCRCWRPTASDLLEYDITRAIAQVTCAQEAGRRRHERAAGAGPAAEPDDSSSSRPSRGCSRPSCRTCSRSRKSISNAEKIPDDIKVLLVIHPRDISEDHRIRASISSCCAAAR